MTGYHLEIGYMSGYSNPRLDTDQEWACLKAAVLALAADPARIVTEAQAFGAPDSADGYPIIAWAALYQDTTAAALTILDTDPVTGEPAQQVMLLASSDGEGRTMKEQLHRAFCRLLIADMHRQGIEISLTVC